MEMSEGFYKLRAWLFGELAFRALCEVRRAETRSCGAALAAVTTVVALLWTILLCVEVFVLFDSSDTMQSECIPPPSRIRAARRADRAFLPPPLCLCGVRAGGLVGVLIFVDALTAIMLPAL